MPETAPSGALTGVRVLDATQMLAGPIAGMRLGDLGADVLKIEPPGRGEFNRTHGFADVDMSGEMTTYLALNRNKRSVAVDLKNDDGRAVLYDLVRECDVFLHNFRVGTPERLGIDHAVLSELNPRLVYCSISGYGQNGPGAARPGQDLIVQGYSGSMYSVGADGDPPTPGALWAADAMTGYQAVIGIMAALIARNRTGEGQHVDAAMLPTVLDAQIQELVTYLNCGIEPTRREEPSAHVWIPAPYGVYETKDSWLTLAMCPLHVLGEALDDDRLRSITDYRDGHRRADEIYRIVRPRFRERTTSDWIAHLDGYNIWAGPVHTYRDLEHDPHVAETEMFTSMSHPVAGDVRTVNVPIRLSGTPAAVRKPPPLLGEHTREVLTEVLGYGPGKVDALAAAGAIGVAATHTGQEVR